MSDIHGIQSMVNIISDLTENDALRKKVDKRIFEFKEVQKADTYKWYEELVFCLLTAYSSAITGLKCVENLIEKNALLDGELHEIEKCIINEGHRFSKQRAQYIYETRHLAPDIKKIITSFQDSKKARLWLKKNIRGIGMKEASHFLRNVGYLDLAIIDRHILSNMKEYDIIKNEKANLTQKRYLCYEEILKKISNKVKMPLGEMDLYLWYRKTGAVLK